MAYSQEHLNLVKRTNKYAKAVAAQYIALNAKKPNTDTVKSAQAELQKQKVKMLEAFKAAKETALTFAVGDVVEPNDSFRVRTGSNFPAMEAHKWPEFGFIITGSDMTDEGELRYQVNRIWPISPSEWRLVYRATAESLGALYQTKPKLAPVQGRKVPTPAMHVEAHQPQVKPECHGCSYYNSKATVAYKCRTKAECPAYAESFQKINSAVRKRK